MMNDSQARRLQTLFGHLSERASANSACAVAQNMTSAGGESFFQHVKQVLSCALPLANRLCQQNGACTHLCVSTRWVSTR
jgi:hypothetical protein